MKIPKAFSISKSNTVWIYGKDEFGHYVGNLYRDLDGIITDSSGNRFSKSITAQKFYSNKGEINAFTSRLERDKRVEELKQKGKWIE